MIDPTLSYAMGHHPALGAGNHKPLAMPAQLASSCLRVEPIQHGMPKWIGPDEALDASDGCGDICIFGHWAIIRWHQHE